MTFQKPPRVAWLTLSLAAFVGFFTLFAILTVSPLLGVIIGDLELSFAEAGFLFSLLVTMIVFGAIAGGYVGDKLGIKTGAGIGAGLVGVGAPLRGLAPEYLTLLVFMGLVGLGYGFLLPNLPKLAAGWFPREFLGKVTGIYMASLFAGAAFALVATLPVHFLLGSSWRITLLLLGLFSSLAAGAWWLAARNPPFPDAPHTSQGLVAQDTRVWTNLQIWLIAIVLTSMNVFFYTLGGWLPTIFAERGSSPNDAGFMASMAYFLAIPATFIIPSLSDRMGRRKPFLWILAIVAAAASYGLLVTPLAFGWFLAGVLGFATAGIIVVCYILPVELVDASSLGRASGIIVSVGFVGGIVGPFMAGFLRDVTQGFAAVVVLLVIAAALAGVAALPIRETGKRGRV